MIMGVKFIMSHMYYIEAIIGINHETVKLLQEKDEKFIRNDKDIVIITPTDMLIYDLYFAIRSDAPKDEQEILDMAKGLASKYFDSFKSGACRFTCDENHKLHLHINESGMSTLRDNKEDTAYLISYYNGYREVPIQVVKYLESLAKQMYKLNKKYGSTIATPINLVSYNPAF